MKIFSALFWLVILAFNYFIYADECKLTDVRKKATIVISTFKKQSNDIQKVLNGESFKGLSSQAIFGHGFSFDKTDYQISELSGLIEQKEGIGIENQSLYLCLKKLELNELAATFQKESINFLNLKIKILKKNKSLNDSLRGTGIAESSLPSLKQINDTESSEALKEKFKLENSLIKKQSQAVTEKNIEKRESFEFEKELTKTKIELLNLKIKTNQNLDDKIDKFEKSSARFKMFSKELDQASDENLIKNFIELEKLWLGLSSEKYYEFFNIKDSLKLPSIPNENDLFFSKNQYLKDERASLVELRKEIVKNYSIKKNHELKLLNNLIESSNSIRENYFDKLGQSYFLKTLFSLDSFHIIKNEFVSVPYRLISYFYTKFLFLREQIELGREGYANLFKIFIKLLFYLIGYWGLKFGFIKLKSQIDKVFEYGFKVNRKSFLLRKMFLIWNKIKDSSIYIMWLVALEVMKSYQLLDGFYLLVSVFEIYLGAKILKSFVTLFLGVVSRLDSTNFAKFKVKAEETSNRFKNIFLFYFLTMVLLEASVGKVYIYTIVNYFIAFYSLYHFLAESTRWESELRTYAEKMFSGIIVEKFFKVVDLFPVKLRSAIIIFFIIVFMIFDLVISLTENLEVSKKISANLFKKQIEKVEAEEGADDKIPSSYKENFSLKSISPEDEYVVNSQKLEDNINLEIKEWREDKSDEHSLVIYGDKGIGKTTLLKKIRSCYTEDKDINTIYTKMPSKTVTIESMHDYLHSLFSDGKREGDFNIYEYEKELEKNTIIIIDECQNMFLSQTDGFEAYYELINIINLNTEKIFWVMSFNKYSWLYLDRAFGRTQFFRNVFEMPGWSDSKIKEMILRRHKKTDFKLSYDLLISATRSQDELDRYSSVESKFFKLIWELSRGNPRSALSLWISALSRKRSNVFNVNIPKELQLEGIEKMPDELLFIIAHVLKHENLTSTEIATVTNLQKGLVRNSIKFALERKLLFRDENSRYMIDIFSQYGLIKYLKTKNFIYGS